jgi:hypothetical protein
MPVTLTISHLLKPAALTLLDYQNLLIIACQEQNPVLLLVYNLNKLIASLDNQMELTMDSNLSGLAKKPSSIDIANLKVYPLVCLERNKSSMHVGHIKDIRKSGQGILDSGCTCLGYYSFRT